MTQNYAFDPLRLQSEVSDFARSVGVEPLDEVRFVFDGSVHRFPVKGDKASEKSGWYVLFSDGWPAGTVGCWRGNISEDWKLDAENLSTEEENYLNSEKCREETEKALKRRQELKKQLEKKTLEKVEKTRIYFEGLPHCDANFPYLEKKNILPFGNMRYCKTRNALAIPLYDVKGAFRSVQWIYGDGTKRFEYETSTKGSFFPLGFKELKNDKDNKLPILIGEGVATMITVFTTLECKYPCVAAMNCGNLYNVAQELKEYYPKRKIIFLADNDSKVKNNPGLNKANEANEKLKLGGVIYPKFQENQNGSDWNDYAALFGNDETKKILEKQITWLGMTDEEKNEAKTRHKIGKFISILDPSIQIEPQEFIGGMYPRRFVSAIVAPSGTGKTMYMQKNVSDLSMGGSIFDGFVEDEPPRKCLIFAGEAGYELLLRRGAQTRWPINPLNVPVIDQYKFESNGITVMLDTEEGWENTKRILSMTKPDIAFWDTFTSFHEKDENKATEMKPIIKNLTEAARNDNFAAVLVHHSRKRSAKERIFSLNQDDVIGSSVFNRLVALIIGIEPLNNDTGDIGGEKPPLLVRPLKTWFPTFMPFTYKISEDINGHTVMQTDLAPASVGTAKIAVWNYIRKKFNSNEWFSLSQIPLSEIEGNPPIWQVRRILASFEKNKKLQRRGATKTLEYSLVNFSDSSGD